jgi:glycosyltransferase involved in cell wall biosynthesis
MADPADAEAFAALVLQVLGNRALGAELIARGLQQAARFSWSAHARRVLAFYREVLLQAGCAVPSGGECP